MSPEVFELDTTDPDLAHETLSRIFRPERPVDFSSNGSGEAFSCRIRSVRCGRVSAWTVRHNMACEAMVPPPGDFTTMLAGSAAGDFEVGREHLRLRTGDVARYPNDQRVRRRWSDLTAAYLRIPFAAITAAGRERFAVDVVRFHSIVPRTPELARYWRGLTEFVHAQLNAADPLLGTPLVEAALVQMIADAALLVFPNSTMTPQRTRGPGRVDGKRVARAEEFIQVNAARSIGVGEVANAMEVPAQVLNAEFLARRGTSLAARLHRTRLCLMNHELSSGRVPGEPADNCGPLM